MSKDVAKSASYQMNRAITATLIEFGATLDRSALFPASTPNAARFALDTPFGFALATCLDRGTKAEIIWSIPFDLYNSLGHLDLDPERIHLMTEKELSGLVRAIPHKPRYINDAPRTIKELAAIVVEKCDGDAANIWRGKSAMEVKATFDSIHGVGPGIASMAVLLIEAGFGIRFSDIDHCQMDIKPDVHAIRVLYRLGIATERTEKSAIQAARTCNPPFPGELDAPLWYIGRNWCDALKPECSSCAMRHLCRKVGVGPGKTL
jgi:endonuclease III